MPHPPSESPSLARGVAFARNCGEALITPSRGPDEILYISLETTRICPYLPSRCSGRERV